MKGKTKTMKIAKATAGNGTMKAGKGAGKKLKGVAKYK